MLKVSMEFRKGILFVRVFGVLDKFNLDIFEKEVKDVIISSGIKYVVLNIKNITNIDSEGIKEIRTLHKMILKQGGAFFLSGGEIKELKTLVNLENELKVFERVVI